MRSPFKQNLLSFCLLAAACGEAQHDFFDDGTAVTGNSSTANGSETSSGGSSSATMTATASGDGTAAGGSATTASDSGGSGVTATADGSGGTTSTGAMSNSDDTVSNSGDAGSTSTSTTASTNTSTTGADNDPECPDTEPEGTTRCNVTIGLTCRYGEVSCVCSGLTWNCVGGDTTAGTGNGNGNGFIGSNGADGFGSGGTFSN